MQQESHIQMKLYGAITGQPCACLVNCWTKILLMSISSCAAVAAHPPIKSGGWRAAVAAFRGRLYNERLAAELAAVSSCTTCVVDGILERDSFPHIAVQINKNILIADVMILVAAVALCSGPCVDGSDTPTASVTIVWNVSWWFTR